MTDDNLPDVVVVHEDDDEDEFVDLDFRLVTLEELPGGGHLVEARGHHGEKVVGFAIALDGSWTAEPIEHTRDSLYWGWATVRSLGLKSDELLSLLDSLYGTNSVPGPMRQETRVAVVGLASDPALVAHEDTHMKLFFESDVLGTYAEVFFNVAPSEGRVELHEKDPEYRRALLQALAVGEGAG